MPPPPRRVDDGGSNAGGYAHAKPEDVILLFNLLKTVDPKNVSCSL